MGPFKVPLKKIFKKKNNTLITYYNWEIQGLEYFLIKDAYVSSSIYNSDNLDKQLPYDFTTWALKENECHEVFLFNINSFFKICIIIIFFMKKGHQLCVNV